MRQIEIKLDDYLGDPTDPMVNFRLGYEYELIGQYASAMGYFLKAAELTDDDKLAEKQYVIEDYQIDGRM